MARIEGIQEQTIATEISMADHFVMFCWSQVGFFVRAKVIRNWRRIIETTVALCWWSASCQYKIMN